MANSGTATAQPQAAATSLNYDRAYVPGTEIRHRLSFGSGNYDRKGIRHDRNL